MLMTLPYDSLSVRMLFSSIDRRFTKISYPCLVLVADWETCSGLTAGKGDLPESDYLDLLAEFTKTLYL